MAVRLVNVSSNVPNIDADVQGFSCQIIGDDTADPFNLNLSKAPFDFKFTVPPSSVDLVLDGIDGMPDIAGTVGTNDAGDVILSCTLSGPIPSITGHIENNALAILSGTFVYNE
jgi:hypothetical protein